MHEGSIRHERQVGKVDWQQFGHLTGRRGGACKPQFQQPTERRDLGEFDWTQTTGRGRRG